MEYFVNKTFKRGILVSTWFLCDRNVVAVEINYSMPIYCTRGI